MREQLLLFRPRSDASFNNFFAGSNNAAVVHAMREWLANDAISFYLYGAQGSGRTHLLQAVCQEYSAAYLPLRELREQNPEQVLEDLENLGILCVDDIQTIIEDFAWCEALFHLFNRCLQSGAKLLISADRASAQLLCALPDLQSRLRASGDFRLQVLADDDLASTLQLRARERGIELSDEVVIYILTRQARAFPALLAVLDVLDKQSLAEKKRITIPFVRHVIEQLNAEK